MRNYHFNIKVKGIVNFSTSFDVQYLYDPRYPYAHDRIDDLDDYVNIDSDGFLHVNGYRITTRNQTIISNLLRYIRGAMNNCPGDRGSGGCIDQEFHVSYENVVCLKNVSSGGGIDRLAKGILHKLFG